MTRIDVERQRGGFPWLPVILGTLAALLLVGLLWYFLGQQPAELGESERPAVTEPGAEADLDTVIRNTGLPREFMYGGMTWIATDAGRYRAEGMDLIAIGPQIEGNELYYEQGTPTAPYETLYLRGEAEGYRDMYVRYEPVQE